MARVEVARYDRFFYLDIFPLREFLSEAKTSACVVSYILCDIFFVATYRNSLVIST